MDNAFTHNSYQQGISDYRLSNPNFLEKSNVFQNIQCLILEKRVQKKKLTVQLLQLQPAAQGFISSMSV